MNLRTAQEVKVRPGAQKSSSTSLPSPIGGLNARDSIANMAGTDAVILENMWPATTSIEVRKGYAAWSTFTGICQTVIVYNGFTATGVFPCVKNGTTFSIFNGTSSGALSVPVVGGAGATIEALTSTRFDYQNFGTTGGNFLTLVNGADVPLQYDGTTWIASLMTGGTPANYFTVGVYQRRRWYGVKDSLDVYYSAVDTITGANTRLNLGPLFKLGGSLSAIITVSDNSNTLTDYIGFLSTEGEIVAFAGTDPSSASTWALAAHFRIGRPVNKGNRAWVKWGSDALVLCADGVYPLRAAISQKSQNSGLAVSDKIRNLINYDITINGGRLGWQLVVHPAGGKLIVNVPTAEDSAAYQYAMNTQTSAWCKFTGWNAMCFEATKDTLYMGMSGKMVKADSGADDGGAAISWDVKQAFNYLGSRSLSKDMKLMRPVMAADGEFNLGVHLDIDYADTPPTYLRTVSGGGGDPWGGIWDVAWSGAIARLLKWYGVGGVGKAVAPRLKGQSTAVSVSWSATDLIYENGAPF